MPDENMSDDINVLPGLDVEIQAMSDCLIALKSLTQHEAQKRVLEWLGHRLLADHQKSAAIGNVR